MGYKLTQTVVYPYLFSILVCRSRIHSHAVVSGYNNIGLHHQLLEAETAVGMFKERGANIPTQKGDAAKRSSAIALTRLVWLLISAEGICSSFQAG